MKLLLSKLWTILALIGLISAMTSNSGLADQVLHKTLKNGNHTAEVQIDQSKISVRLSRDTEDNPRSILLSFRDENNKSTTLELKSLSPPNPEEPGVSSYTGVFLDNRIPGESSSSLSPSQQSFIGIELRIPIPLGEPEILR